jgi:hypothetical protein
MLFSPPPFSLIRHAASAIDIISLISSLFSDYAISLRRHYFRFTRHDAADAIAAST